MMDENTKDSFSKFFKVHLAPEIDVNEKDVFFREKYNDILNYIKAMITFQKDSLITNYYSPKGYLLISTNPGSDTIDFLKFVSKNYTLNYVELDQEEIYASGKEFRENFALVCSYGLDIINTIVSKIKERGTQKDLESNHIAVHSIFVFNEDWVPFKMGDNLIESILVNINDRRSLLETGVIFIWLNQDYDALLSHSINIHHIFDATIKIPRMNSVERKTLLSEFCEHNPQIVFDVETIHKYIENWESGDIIKFLKLGIFKHFINSELNDKSNEITDTLINLVKCYEFIPSNMRSKTEKEQKVIRSNHNQHEYSMNIQLNNPESNVEEILKELKEQKISDFMVDQLYENAAANHYMQLLIIIDKLNKREVLESTDYKLLSNYAFILSDNPKKALIHLEKAKKKVDQLNQVFKKRS